MRRLRRALTPRTLTALLVPVMLCLVLTQAISLHVHTCGTLLGMTAAPTVHVTGGAEHVAPGDEMGEIQLDFDVLVLSAQWSSDAAVVGLPSSLPALPPLLRPATSPPARDLPSLRRAFGPSTPPPAHAPPC
ncbi:MAG: hypothetical protein RLW61_02560 [Gammaproteobacteria bacterium]